MLNTGFPSQRSRVNHPWEPPRSLNKSYKILVPKNFPQRTPENPAFETYGSSNNLILLTDCGSIFPTTHPTKYWYLRKTQVDLIIVSSQLQKTQRPSISDPKHAVRYRITYWWKYIFGAMKPFLVTIPHLSSMGCFLVCFLFLVVFFTSAYRIS